MPTKTTLALIERAHQIDYVNYPKRPIPKVKDKPLFHIDNENHLKFIVAAVVPGHPTLGIVLPHIPEDGRTPDKWFKAQKQAADRAAWFHAQAFPTPSDYDRERVAAALRSSDGNDRLVYGCKSPTHQKEAVALLQTCLGNAKRASNTLRLAGHMGWPSRMLSRRDWRRTTVSACATARVFPVSRRFVSCTGNGRGRCVPGYSPNLRQGMRPRPTRHPVF